ncbi:MAG TPA: hypothetical protein PLF84_03110 [Bryobacteraceae bacterium]|nr:hypothetical protein [Bryobacterales bacterium]HRJ17998.1 hypothetical protein [Bryobacteraceae bacterium]
MGRGRSQIRPGGSEGRELLAGAGPALIRALAPIGPLQGQPLQIEWRRGLRTRGGRLESGPGPGQPVHAASYPRKRLLVLDSSLRRHPAERARIFVHELFHFVWARLANTERRSWETLVSQELDRSLPGELGWSSEWRKLALRPDDPLRRSRRWREYACESFCDSAAWLWAGLQAHDEFTLPPGARSARRLWLETLQRHHSAGWRI